MSKWILKTEYLNNYIADAIKNIANIKRIFPTGWLNQKSRFSPKT
jgi:hypothetical protein